MLGKEIQESGNGTIAERVQEKLSIMNKNWEVLQERALNQTQMSVEHPMNEPSLISSVTPPPLMFSPVRARSPDSDEKRINLKDSQQQAHLKYQLLFSEIFDWLSSCDESLSEAMQTCSIVEILKSRIFGVQVTVTMNRYQGLR